MTLQQSKYLFILEAMAATSECKDKHVAALAVDAMDNIVGLSVNIPFACNGLCNKTCKAFHAEQCLHFGNIDNVTVYLNLYPCEDCQRILAKQGRIKEIIVFGTQHKEDLGLVPIICINVPFDFLKKFNTKAQQQCVAAGEFAELITELMDDQRIDTKERDSSVHAEMVDAFIQLFLLKENIMDDWHQKINKLIFKHKTGGFNDNSRTES